MSVPDSLLGPPPPPRDDEDEAREADELARLDRLDDYTPATAIPRKDAPMSGLGHDTETLYLTVKLPDDSEVLVTGDNDGVNGFTWSARYANQLLPVEVEWEVLVDGITPADDELPPHDPECCHDDCQHPNLDHAADGEPCRSSDGVQLTQPPESEDA